MNTASITNNRLIKSHDVCKNRQLVKVTISNIQIFIHIGVIYERKTSKKLFLENFVTYWILQPVEVVLAFQQIVLRVKFKEFSIEAQICTLTNICLKDDQKKLKVGIYLSMWYSSLHENPCLKTLQKRKLVPTLGSFICQCLHSLIKILTDIN